MSLREKLDQIRTGAVKRIPPDKLAIMHRATDDLRRSGIVDRAIAVGATLPPFSLLNTRGERVESQNLLERGAVVLTVFRGHW